MDEIVVFWLLLIVTAVLFVGTIMSRMAVRPAAKAFAFWWFGFGVIGGPLLFCYFLFTLFNSEEGTFAQMCEPMGYTIGFVLVAFTVSVVLERLDELYDGDQCYRS